MSSVGAQLYHQGLEPGEEPKDCPHCAPKVVMAVDSNDDVKPDPTASGSAEQVASILGPHYERR